MTHITLPPGDDYTTVGVDVVAAQSLTRRLSMGVLTRRNVLLGTIVGLAFAAMDRAGNRKVVDAQPAIESERHFDDLAAAH